MGARVHPQLRVGLHRQRQFHMGFGLSAGFPGLSFAGTGGVASCGLTAELELHPAATKTATKSTPPIRFVIRHSPN